MTDRERSLEFFVRAIHAPSSASHVVVTFRVPTAPLSTFLDAVPREMSLMWHPPDGSAAAASGVAAETSLHGMGRLGVLREWVERTFSTMEHRLADDVVEPVVPRVFGGLAFHPGFAHRDPWRAFGDGHFVLPRWTYRREGSHSTLSFASSVEALGRIEERDRALAELDSILPALSYGEGKGSHTRLAAIRPIPTSNVLQGSRSEWYELVLAIKAAIASGKFTKLVAASRCVVMLDQPLDDIEVITRLVAEPSCTRFAFRRNAESFVGASPETLFSKAGRQVKTEALAGTIRSLGSDPPLLRAQQDRLLGSDKDAIEHELVVREISAGLRELADSVSHPPHAETRKIRNIIHLSTPFGAHLRDGVRALDVLSVLHPTPAVGGVPRADAARWIARHELADRGWYTGPVGWIDAADDASFVVGIRSGVIAEKAAHVYTGAGIVAESDGEVEYAEIQLKQLPLLRALGVEIL